MAKHVAGAHQLSSAELLFSWPSGCCPVRQPVVIFVIYLVIVCVVYENYFCLCLSVFIIIIIFNLVNFQLRGREHLPGVRAEKCAGAKVPKGSV